MATSIAFILTIQDGGDASFEAGLQNLFDLRYACRNTRHHLGICQLFEGFFFGHAGILSDLPARV